VSMLWPWGSLTETQKMKMSKHGRYASHDWYTA